MKMMHQFILCILIIQVSTVHCILDLMVSGKEMQKLLFGAKDEIKIVENGTISNFVESDVARTFPPIQPQYYEMKLQIKSKQMLYYTIHLESSDGTIMPTPTVTIPIVGRLSRQWIVFHIRFPCTGRKSGTVDMKMVFNFFTDSKRKDHYKKVKLTMKRQCQADPIENEVEPTGCQTKCDLENFRKRFCLSSFIARVKIVRVPNPNDAEPYYLANMKRLFKKPLSETTKRNQYIKAVQVARTCDCKPLEPNKKYLVFGREFRSNKTLYFDEYSVGYEIKTKEEKELVRKFRKIYRTIWCPRLLRYMFGGNNHH
ncbi:protein shifted-like [Clytia hemisphaerica]|uniref:Cnidarian restricted protein n=1 Tax=Clytia hemisphaerica TaxID=252671 RepID=A0A7M5UUI0_9CNID|eukprot:TCONS_00072129-protein